MTTTIIELRGRLRGCALAAALAVSVAGCASPPGDEAATTTESWSVTAWGERFEVFPEVDVLVAGEAAVAHTHVTELEGFAPLVDGQVEIVLAGSGGERVFAADEPVRPGIFSVEIRPDSPGEHDLLFRIRDAGGSEEIRGGRVRVGTAEEPGGLLVAPAPKGGSDGGEPLSFLKEQQWRSDFATAWVRTGSLAVSVSGLARIRPPAGGESTLTATVAGVVQPPPGSSSWPFAGMPVGRGDALFQVVPLVAADRSLPTIEAELATLTTELGTARARLARLQELFELEATSRREVEEAETRVETLAARHSAAAQDLDAALSSRSGGQTEQGLVVRAPFSGELAGVTATPGATVDAGDPLARLVRRDVIWIEAALPPAGAQRLVEKGVRGVVLSDPEHGALRLETDVRLIAVAPELSPSTGTLTVLLAAPSRPALTLGAAFDARVLSAEERPGIVVPASALVDDGGVPVVYLQLSGESFVRQEVRVLERQGELLLVEGLTPGQRLVTRDGEAIRRASLTAGGDPHGHLH